MKKFSTLVWLEHRRNWLWSLPLMASLLFWAWGIKQVTVMDVGERLAIRAGLLMGAATIGTVLLVMMIGRIRSETRNGQYQVLLMSPPSGYTHILSRFTYAAGIALAYFIAIGFMFWWILELAGIRLDAGSLFDLILAMPLYGMSIMVLPILAYTLLLMVFISAYRLSGAGWIPGSVMLLGTPILMQYIGDWTSGWMYTLPGWHVFANAPAALIARFGDLDPESAIEVGSVLSKGLPVEPMLIMLTITAALLAIAGRIWQEVEA
ncbi:hypothetical protein KKG90_01740 [Candidatus Bipolaricaulota bacterium]|nr:hypothetical protein [Candidatus Bipolaricaulota bacterium]